MNISQFKWAMAGKDRILSRYLWGVWADQLRRAGEKQPTGSDGPVGCFGVYGINFFSVCGGSWAAAVTAGAISVAFFLFPPQQQPQAVAADDGKEEPIPEFHSRPPIW